MLDRLEFHYTPKHGSWLNIAEIELSVLTQQCLARRIPDMNSLNKETVAWNQVRNEMQKGVDCSSQPKCTDKIKEALSTIS